MKQASHLWLMFVWVFAGGWPKDAHLLFVKLRGLALKDLGSHGNQSKAGAMAKLARMMPGHTLQHLKQHEEW
jgi:hypothetical protein